jgi:type IV pilus assembly protein PilB
MDKGYKGRTGIYEVLVIDEMVRDMILSKKTSQEISRATRQAGTLATLQEDAAQKILDGITTIEEATSAIMVL